MILVIIILFHLFILGNLTFTAWPEMLSYPYLYSNGFSLYKEIIIPYTPGLIFLQTLIFNFFGYNPLVLKIYAWVLILITDILIYFILSKVNKNIAPFFLLVFVLLQSFFDGNMVWFDCAFEIPILLASLFLNDYLKKRDSKKLFFISSALAMAIFIKQIAVIFYLGFIAIFIFSKLPSKKRLITEILIILGPAAFLLLLFITYLLFTGSLHDFYVWSLYYPLKYWSSFPGYVDINITRGRALLILLILIPISLALLKLRILLKNRRFIFILTFFVASMLAVYPRFSYFHLQPTLAFFVILSSIIFTNFEGKLRLIFLGTFSVCIFLLLIIVWNENYLGNSTRFYSDNDKKISLLISEKVNSNEKVFFLGLPSSYYVFSNRTPPKPWADNFGWYLEIPGVQEEIIEGFKKEHLKWVFWKRPQEGPWFELGSYQPQKILKYLRENFQKIDNIDNIEIWETKN